MCELVIRSHVDGGGGAEVRRKAYPASSEATFMSRSVSIARPRIKGTARGHYILAGSGRSKRRKLKLVDHRGREDHVTNVCSLSESVKMCSIHRLPPYRNVVDVILGHRQLEKAAALRRFQIRCMGLDW